jgi:hypothetical protein
MKDEAKDYQEMKDKAKDYQEMQDERLNDEKTGRRGASVRVR